jgi:DNA-binding GntR family transcriptional regulator
MQTTKPASIQGVTTAGALAARLREQIDSGERRAGEVLRQEQLAAEFGVSRIPIREALAQLQAEGLLRVEHYRGARITLPSAQEIDEIFDLRLLVEGDLLARAVPRHDERTLREVQRRQAVLEQAEAPLDWIAGDRAFHEALYVPASRARSLQIYFQLRTPIDRLSVQRLSPAARKEPWAIEHRGLIAAIRAADARAAVAALTDHLNETRALVLAARRSMGDS